MKLSELQNKFIFKTRIDLDDEDYIVLREPNTAEIAEMSEDEKKNMKVMEKILPNCIVETSITKDDGSFATGKEICEVLKESGSMFTEVLSKWIQSIPFQSRTPKQEK